ncbi:hypothetical protein H6G94_02135 [Nostoc punctiforme FACHB-252]|jgi:hypothetical protein|uniref:Uncharacterized protein n=1 Tax=Nostoc punctiforme FACHB-252 TaxID=1357509 RepID=A0ABR8H487_NOSPU|nr:hypothetical protein [Nostoc punctiforme]MBD2610081.1 hypothetical protein [Nostoc punctiforme FACHB-252]
MFQRILKSSFLGLLLVAALLNLAQESVIAETSIGEDELNTVNGMSWAGDKLPFDAVVNIQDSLVNSLLGKVVIERHGEDKSGGIFKSPFDSPRPGRFVVVSLWGSKIEGCFVKIIVQSAPFNGQADLDELVPQLIELGIDGQILQLTPSPNIKPRGFSGKYTYTVYENNTNYERSSTWYMTDTSFAINADAANMLRTAPAKEVKGRLTFVNGDTKVFPIGKKNVQRWQEAYSFNNSCTAPK